MFGWHTQNLRADSLYEQNTSYFNYRGWFTKWRWQFLIYKYPLCLHRCLQLMLTTTSSGKIEGFNIGLLGIFLYITFERDCEYSYLRSYGFGFDVDHVFFKWHHRWFSSSSDEDAGYLKIINYPWNYAYCKTEYVDKQGNWLPALWSDQPGIRLEKFPYTYTLKSGEVQKRTATVSTIRQTWRRKFFGLGKYNLTPKKVCVSIDVQFDKEVGEQTGSWKGGTVGCSYKMLPGETTEQTLRRMERERKFN